MYKPLILTGQEPNKNQTNKQTNKTQNIFFERRKDDVQNLSFNRNDRLFLGIKPHGYGSRGSRDSLSEDCSGREGDRRSFSISLSWGLWRFLIFFLAQRVFWIGRGNKMRGRETTIYDWLILTVNGLFKLLFFFSWWKNLLFFYFFFFFLSTNLSLISYKTCFMCYIVCYISTELFSSNFCLPLIFMLEYLSWKDLFSLFWSETQKLYIRGLS